MSIASEISRISENVSAALSALAEREVNVPAGASSASLAELIAAVPGGLQLPDFLHRLEFQSFTLSSAGNLHETSYVIGSDYNAGRPNFAIGWTDGAVSGTNEVIQFVHWTDYEAPYEKISYIYANDYGAFTSYAKCVYLADANGTGRATIQLYSPPDIATSSRPGTNFTFAANVKYNLIIGKFKDRYNA